MHDWHKGLGEPEDRVSVGTRLLPAVTDVSVPNRMLELIFMFRPIEIMLRK